MRMLLVAAGNPTPRPRAVSICSVTDDELVLLAQQGDTSAFDQLVTRYERVVFRAALAALRVPEDAQDATQDTFIKAWSKLGIFRGDASFKTWLLTIAWNVAVNRRRMRLNWWRRAVPMHASMSLSSHGPSAHDDLSARELREHIADAIERLSPKLRDALLLAQSGAFEYVEIARMLGISDGTVKWRVSEARRRVRERLVAIGYRDV